MEKQLFASAMSRSSRFGVGEVFWIEFLGQVSHII